MQEDTRWLYGFLATRIQRYLMASPKLKDIQGASQLVEELCTDRFDAALRAAGLPRGAVLSQAAGGARVYHSDGKALQHLYAAWPMLTAGFAPGVTVQQALLKVRKDSDLPEAQRELGELLKAGRGDPLPSLPEIGPLIRRNPRTAQPAVRIVRHRDAEEVLDLSTWRKRETLKNLKSASRLDQRFLGEQLKDLAFASGSEDRDEGLVTESEPYVGVIHADGNEIGATIERAIRFGEHEGRKRAELFQAISRAISLATQQAAQEAVRRVLAPCARDNLLPARPIVLGGDDLTLIVRGDLAIDFSRCFLATFERAAEEQLAPLGVPGPTACAGVAITKHKFPFDRAHELAESLCRQAKRNAKQRRSSESQAAPSSLAFHRVTTSLPGDAETVLENELRGREIQLTLEAYGVGRWAAALPTLASLARLAEALPGDQHGPIRELITALKENPAAAQVAFERLVEIGNLRAGGPARVDALKNALAALTGGPERLWDDAGRTPLLDALVMRRFNADKEQEIRK